MGYKAREEKKLMRYCRLKAFASFGILVGANTQSKRKVFPSFHLSIQASRYHTEMIVGIYIVIDDVGRYHDY